MRRFLFISFTSEQSYTGGMQCSRRNLQSLKVLWGEQNVDTYIITPYQNRHKLFTKFKRVRDIFLGYMGGLDKKREIEILRLFETKKYTDLYIDSSLLGILAKRIKQINPSIRIYTFFHNVEFDFVKHSVRVNRDYWRFYWLPLAKLNEKYACQYSDRIIALNQRDALGLEKLYGRSPDICIPITFKSSYAINPTSILRRCTGKKALFVGSYFYGNVEGIRWFCKNVLPIVDIHLIIVGAGMDNLVNDIGVNEKVTIASNVPDLTPYYEDADFVVLPILSGGGMKVKTAEALMYGKFILATKEALIGYDVTPDIACQCDSSDDFVKAISNLNISYKFNEASRKLFDAKYSFDASLPLFKQLLSVE